MMDQAKLTEIQKIELEILKAVVNLCDHYSLRYFIYCGTLLGAVRHRGFIPWDDDIDLAMPLEDYRKFLEHADELPAGLSCVHRGNTPDYQWLWAKVAADGTTFMYIDFAELDRHWGISLDIYPLIGTPATKWGRKLQKLLISIMRRLQFVSVYQVKRIAGNDKLYKKFLGGCPYFMRQGLINVLSYLCILDTDSSEYVGSLDWAPFEGKFMWKDWQEMIRLPFEDATFWAPARYDKLLRRMYGDYMQLPPEEARMGHAENNVIIDPHRDYRLYRKELLGK